MKGVWNGDLPCPCKLHQSAKDEHGVNGRTLGTKAAGSFGEYALSLAMATQTAGGSLEEHLAISLKLPLSPVLLVVYYPKMHW